MESDKSLWRAARKCVISKGTLILREINPKTHSKWYCLFNAISSTFITTQLFLTPKISHFWMWLNLHSVEICFTVCSYKYSFGEQSLKKVNPFQAHSREYLLRSSWRMITLNRNFEGWVNGGIIVSSKIKRVWNTFSGKPLGYHMCVWKRARMRAATIKNNFQEIPDTP